MFGLVKGGHGSRPLDSFNIPPAILSRLLGAGFHKVGDLSELQPTELALEAGLTADEASAILKQIAGGADAPKKKTALELLEAEDAPGIITFVREIDDMLGRGVAMGKITEFCGAPGLGKTQLGMQLAIDVHLPNCVDGPAGECIYIDTEGSFTAQRAAEMAAATVKALRERVAQNTTHALSEQDMRDVNAFTEDSVLSTIYYFRVHNYVEQVALVNVLRDRITQQLPRVKLVVIDSVAFHFRRAFDDYSIRTRLLGNMSQTLIELAKEFNLAVVLMNQVTTRINNGKTELIPALGETWGHACTNRIMLVEERGVRWAKLLKSPNRKKDCVPYCITEDGLRSVEKISEIPQQPNAEDEEENE